jgi:soluble lytic murein transglycosylase-like protein
MGGNRRAARIFVAVVLGLALAACGHRKDVLPETAATASPSSTATLERYARIIREQGTRYRVPPALIGAIVAVESGGNAHALNPSGSAGLMQIKPATAARYGVTDLFDPVDNITAGTRYLHDLLVRFHHDLRLTVAAYKLGPAAVNASGGVPPSAKNYVERVMGIYDAVLEALNP